MRLHHDEGAEVALANAPKRFAEERISAGLEIHQKHPLAGRGAASGLGDGLAAGHIHRHRLGQEHMFPGADRHRRVVGVEIGGRLDDHSVQLGGEQPFVAGQPGVTPGRLDAVFRPHRIRSILEIIRAGDEPVLAGLGKQIRDPRTATAAADEAEFESSVRLRAEHGGAVEQVERGRRGSRDQELATTKAVLEFVSFHGIMLDGLGGAGP
jgi:hypothetical protein